MWEGSPSAGDHSRAVCMDRSIRVPEPKSTRCGRCGNVGRETHPAEGVPPRCLIVMTSVGPGDTCNSPARVARRVGERPVDLLRPRSQSCRSSVH